MTTDQRTAALVGPVRRWAATPGSKARALGRDDQFVAHSISSVRT